MATSHAKALDFALKNLPEHYYADFSRDFLILLAALRMHGFSILRADEPKDFVGNGDDLWVELGHPSVWLYAPKTITLRNRAKASKSEAENIEYTNQIIQYNLVEQERLLGFLATFYKEHQASSFYSRLIVENLNMGESFLHPQGANVRLIAHKTEQQKLAKEFMKEMVEFGECMAKTPPDRI